MARTGQLYIFGDSLSDDGASAVQLQQEPIDLYFAGRASNGPVWHEYIRNDLAVAPAATSISQAPGFDGYLGGSDLNGINFAHAGAVSDSDSKPNLPGAVQQAQGFAALVASGDIPAPDDQDVFVIWIGGNDFLRFADAGLSDILDILDLDRDIVDNIDTAVDTLVAAGARNFVFLGQPTIGGAFLGDTAPDGSFLAGLWNRLVADFNDALSDYADAVNGVPGQSALFVDIADLVKQIEDDPARFGFVNVTGDILSDGAALDDQSYFSVDGVHPTGAGHAVIAEYVTGVAAEAGFDLTALAGNVLPGSARDDVLRGTDGNDTFTGGPGDDLLEGRAGNDLAQVSGAMARYTLTIGSEITLTDRQGMDGRDRLDSIETLGFADTSFDLTRFDDGANLSAEAFRGLVEMYISYFDRAPDALGLSFWADALANGTDLPEIARAFAASPEAQAVYPSALSEADFVAAVYQNALGRPADQAGFDFWSGALSSGAVDRAEFVLALLQGVRAPAPTEVSSEFAQQQAADRSWLDTKIDIGLHFAAIHGLSDPADAATVMQLFDGSAESLSAAIAATDTAYAEASGAEDGQFLVQIVGVVEDPFAV